MVNKLNYNYMHKITRRERFEKVAGSRVKTILKALEILEKCANKNNYEYGEDDIKKMEKALRDKLMSVLKSFGTERSKGKDIDFKF